MKLRDPDESPIVHMSSDDWSVIRAFGSTAMVLDLADSADPVTGIENYISFLRKKVPFINIKLQIFLN